MVLSSRGSWSGTAQENPSGYQRGKGRWYVQGWQDSPLPRMVMLNLQNPQQTRDENPSPDVSKEKPSQEGHLPLAASTQSSEYLRPFSGSCGLSFLSDRIFFSSLIPFLPFPDLKHTYLQQPWSPGTSQAQGSPSVSPGQSPAQDRGSAAGDTGNKKGYRK